jgi:hypothetical protein
MSYTTEAKIEYAERRGISVEDVDVEEYKFWQSVQDGSYWNDVSDRQLDRLDARDEAEVD